VIIRFPAKQTGIFTEFITEAAVKCLTAAVPPQQELHWLP